ncbi:unnamed protein product [Boreogadus saida]
MVTLPYIRDVTEKVQRAMKKHLISTPVKPHIKLWQVFVHPKDRLQPEKKCDSLKEKPAKEGLFRFHWSWRVPMPNTGTGLLVTMATDLPGRPGGQRKQCWN